MDWAKLNNKINHLVRAESVETRRQSLDSFLALTDSESCLYFLTDKKSKKFKSYYSVSTLNSHRNSASGLLHQRIMLLVNDCANSTSSSVYESVMSFLGSFKRYSVQVPIGECYQLQIISFRRLESYSVEEVRNLHIVASALLPWANYLVKQCEKRQKANIEFVVDPLTNAESEVLDLLAKGMDGSEVAEVRGVSKETVRSQIKCLLQKTGTRHQNELLSRYYMNVSN